jgi:hypothetical protein
MKLSPHTMARLVAVADTMGISIEQLVERCVLDSLPTIEHEDLLGTKPEETIHEDRS